MWGELDSPLLALRMKEGEPQTKECRQLLDDRKSWIFLCRAPRCDSLPQWSILLEMAARQQIADPFGLHSKTCSSVLCYTALRSFINI